MTASSGRIAQTWDHFWFSSVDARSLGAFRFLHGFSLLAFLTIRWRDAVEWISTDSFHIGSAPALQVWLLPVFGIIQFAAAISFTVGLRMRLSALFSWLCLLYVTLVDRASAFAINDIYLFTFAVFFTFDPRKPADLSAQLRLLQLAMVAIYFSSGWNKAVFGTWLDSPTTLSSCLQGIYMTDVASRATLDLPPYTWTIFQYLVLAFELLSPVLFSVKKLRFPAVLIGCAFHIGIAVFMDQLLFFSLQMMSFYILFLDGRLDLAEWLRRRVFDSRSGKESKT